MRTYIFKSCVYMGGGVGGGGGVYLCICRSHSTGGLFMRPLDLPPQVSESDFPNLPFIRDCYIVTIDH
jgi:hypothetical protein